MTRIGDTLTFGQLLVPLPHLWICATTTNNNGGVIAVNHMNVNTYTCKPAKYTPN